MKQEKAARLRNGIYIVYWKSGGKSIAAVGQKQNGKMWLAPINWIFAGSGKMTWGLVKKVQFVGDEEWM